MQAVKARISEREHNERVKTLHIDHSTTEIAMNVLVGHYDLRCVHWILTIKVFISTFKCLYDSRKNVSLHHDLINSLIFAVDLLNNLMKSLILECNGKLKIMTKIFYHPSKAYIIFR